MSHFLKTPKSIVFKVYQAELEPLNEKKRPATAGPSFSVRGRASENELSWFCNFCCHMGDYVKFKTLVALPIGFNSNG